MAEECAAALTTDGAAAPQEQQPHTLFSAAIAGAPKARAADGALLTDGFLDLCELIIPLIGV
jgi:hypothetical protein